MGQKIIAKRLAQYFRYAFARNRRSWPVRAMARAAREVLWSYHNCSTNTRLNGEEFVLRSLAAADTEGAGLGVVFDVGANRGHWAQRAIALCPGARIFCFEPVPATYRLLEATVKPQPAITPWHLALGDRVGEVQFRYFPGHDTLSAVNNPSVHALDYEVVTCPMTTGDQFMQERGLDRVDFLKLDVEGAEMPVLSGFRSALEQKKIRAVQFEYGMASILSKVLLYDLCEFFRKLDFSVGAIYPNYVDFRPYKFTDENFLTPNFLALPHCRADLIRRLQH